MSLHHTLFCYFRALQTRDGALAASLFTPDGVIDDFRGKRHAGPTHIAQFIDQVPRLRLEYLSECIQHKTRMTVYGRITYPGVESVLVRWIFSIEGERIAHLGNSRIEHIPPEYRLMEPRDATPAEL